MQGFPFDSQLTFDDENLPVYDRAVSSQPLRKLIRDLFTTGVMPNPSTNLQVSSGLDGMTVQVQAGFAVVDGGLCQETETRTLEVTAADTTYDRIDTVVLRWDENVDVRKADLYVIAGTPSATPVRPTLQRDNSIYEIGLADVFITKRVATITDDKITDTRYEAERCGIVSSVSEWDTTTIYQQIQAELAGFKANEEADFATWFDYMKDQLSEDAAGHLQEEIDELKEVEYTSSDTELEPTTSETVALLTSGETAPSRWTKVSKMFKNIRYLFKRVGELNNGLSAEVSARTQSVINLQNELSAKAPNTFPLAEVSNDYIIPEGINELYITVAVNNNPEILLQAFWSYHLIAWWGNVTKGFRVVGKSAPNGVEYGAIIGYDTSTRRLSLNSCWQGSTIVGGTMVIYGR